MKINIMFSGLEFYYRIIKSSTKEKLEQTHTHPSFNNLAMYYNLSQTAYIVF